uniref:Uncharacterized protein n=1 Tax=Rhizophora mucronata TaxID=61149 RepID=A0A2P2P1M7_RHIMU
MRKPSQEIHLRLQQQTKNIVTEKLFRKGQ